LKKVYFINEVSCFDWPVLLNFVLLDGHLFGENVVSNFLTRLSHVRPSAKHALVGHDSHCEIVDCLVVILSAHDFWSHVAWSSRSILCIFLSPYSCNSEICDSEITYIQVRPKVNSSIIPSFWGTYHLHQGLDFQAWYLYAKYFCRARTPGLLWDKPRRSLNS